jgi:HlyD family secretion protein
MKTKWWVMLIVLALIVAGSLWSAAQPDAMVQVVEPRVGTIEAYVEEQAVTQLPFDHLISMPIDGWLESIPLREGDAVRRGQVVAQLDTEDLRDRVIQAEQRIAVLETQIREARDDRLEENAKVQMDATVVAIDEMVEAAEARLEASAAVMQYNQEEVDRLSELSRGDAASQRELRLAQLELSRATSDYRGDALELAAMRTIAAVSYIGPKFVVDYIARKSFTLEQRRNELLEARTQRDIEQRNLDRAAIVSPIDGQVLERYETRRQFLTAGTPLLTIGRLDDMEVIADVLTERAVHIAPGDPVEIFGKALADGPVAGHVTRVYPAGFKKISSLGVEQQRVDVAIGFDQRPEQLGVGFRVYVRIIHDRADDALTLPRTCLFRAADGAWQVLVVDGDRLAIREVEVGLMNDDVVQITRGVEPRDRIVTKPSRELEADMRVRIAP